MNHIPVSTTINYTTVGIFTPLAQLDLKQDGKRKLQSEMMQSQSQLKFMHQTYYLYTYCKSDVQPTSINIVTCFVHNMRQSTSVTNPTHSNARYAQPTSSCKCGPCVGKQQVHVAPTTPLNRSHVSLTSQCGSALPVRCKAQIFLSLSLSLVCAITRLQLHHDYSQPTNPCSKDETKMEKFQSCIEK